MFIDIQILNKKKCLSQVLSDFCLTFRFFSQLLQDHLWKLPTSSSNYENFYYMLSTPLPPSTLLQPVHLCWFHWAKVEAVLSNRLIALRLLRLLPGQISSEYFQHISLVGSNINICLWNWMFFLVELGGSNS